MACVCVGGVEETNSSNFFHGYLWSWRAYLDTPIMSQWMYLNIVHKPISGKLRHDTKSFMAFALCWNSVHMSLLQNTLLLLLARTKMYSMQFHLNVTPIVNHPKPGQRKSWGLKWNIGHLSLGESLAGYLDLFGAAGLRQGIIQPSSRGALTGHPKFTDEMSPLLHNAG